MGGDLNAKVSKGSSTVVADATAQLPTAWVAASAAGDPPLKIQLLSGFQQRAHYNHRYVNSIAAKVRRLPPEPDAESTVGTIPGERTPEQIADVLRQAHPEAYDDEEWKRKGKLRGRKAMLSPRVRNITNIRHNPRTGIISFDCERERFERERPTAEVVAIIKTDPTPDATMHELGHRMENTVLGLQRLASTWRDRRTESGERVQVGPGHRGRSEWGYEGGFVDPYVGKIYPSGDTEVISIGLESVLTGSYGGLAGDGREHPGDPDHRAFVLGLLATAGRDPTR